MLLIEHLLDLKPVTGTTVLAILLLSGAGYLRGSNWISSAFVVSLAFALYATVYGTHMHFIAGCTIAFFIALADESKEGDAIAGLYIFRASLTGLVEINAIAINTMWTFNLFLLWLQMLVAVSTLLPDSGRKRIAGFLPSWR